MGFGPKVLKVRGKETEYCIGLLPFGGFVKMLEEGKAEQPILPEEKYRTFEAQPLWKRVVIVLAGPAMNLVFPVALYTSVYLEDIGTYSSPRIADLNGDGIPDIVMGAGGQEGRPSAKAVIALDGYSGETLWVVPGINQVVGSPVFQDLNKDGTPDVIIGGRWAQLLAIDGKTGASIWSFYAERKSTDGSDGGWFNFTTPQLVPDQDRDGLPDLVVANGGDARKAAGDPDRPAGRILVLSSATGKILANAVVPDGMETYMSVVCDPRVNDIFLYYGTGGESLGGHLYRTTLRQLMTGDLRNSVQVASGVTKGFVSSPVLVDLNHDHINDVVVNTADGRMLAIDGNTDSTMWLLQFPGTEAYTMPAPGRFTNDSIPDFLCNFAIGVFPDLQRSIRFMVDGSNGKVLYQDTIPSFQYASGITADLDGDGFDEGIMNQSEMKRTQFEYKYYSYLIAFDFHRNTRYGLGDTVQATNFASTPWLGDMDNDGTLDIISSSVLFDGVKLDLEKPRGLRVSRYVTNKLSKAQPRWGAFMGSEYTGRYP
ncbi:MAG: RIP metalloprotease [Chitinophagaceae bacterium]|nr:MAG: RIP metalloprotease [Chitinophagaceae bacterium]